MAARTTQLPAACKADSTTVGWVSATCGCGALETGGPLGRKRPDFFTSLKNGRNFGRGDNAGTSTRGDVAGGGVPGGVGVEVCGGVVPGGWSPASLSMGVAGVPGQLDSPGSSPVAAYPVGR